MAKTNFQFEKRKKEMEKKQKKEEKLKRKLDKGTAAPEDAQPGGDADRPAVEPGALDSPA